MFFHFDDNNLVHPSDEMAAFVDRLIQRLIEEGLYYDGPDRRSEKRHVVAIPVRAMPLDGNLRPAGAGFIATARDISRRGIAVIHSQVLTCPLLAVELADFDGRQIQAAVEVLRCRPVGPYFEIAGTFVTKVYDPLRRVQAPPVTGLLNLLRRVAHRLQSST
jgi:hypothetical protein